MITINAFFDLIDFSPGTDKDVDFYTVKEGPLLPPTTGWVSCNKSVRSMFDVRWLMVNVSMFDGRCSMFDV